MASWCYCISLYIEWQLKHTRIILTYPILSLFHYQHPSCAMFQTIRNTFPFPFCTRSHKDTCDKINIMGGCCPGKIYQVSKMNNFNRNSSYRRVTFFCGSTLISIDADKFQIHSLSSTWVRMFYGVYYQAPWA